MFATLCPGSGAKEIAALVHRLVAKAFIPNPESKPQVNHKNGIKSDNRVENLEWNTMSENILHSFRELGRKRVGLKGEKQNKAKLKEHQVIEIRKLYADGVIGPELAKRFGVSHTTIYGVTKLKTWKHIAK